MVVVEPSLVLSLLTVTALAYALVSLVPRVDAMTASYRKFAALTALGISYLVLLPLIVAVVAYGSAGSPIGTVLTMGVVAFVLFGLTLLYDVFDDWIRLFADPEYNTWVEVSMVVALVIVLAAFLLLVPEP